MEAGIRYTETRPSEASTDVFAYQPRRGLSIPSVTVLDPGGKVIEAEQRSLFRYNAQAGYGADIIFGVGTTGEWNRLTNIERQRLIRIEADEVARINEGVTARGLRRVEAWAGVTAPLRAETLANLECALDAGVDAAVIAPLSIRDLGDIISFFHRDVSDLFDHRGRGVPIFLYDNADIAADPRIPHIRTRDVKRLSRLPFIFGLKVSAPRRVLGNYTKGALHYKEKGGFGVYVGNAMLMFQVFKLEDGLRGRMREYWNRYLLHNELPVGVVSGPANLLPREWQRAWRACYAADDHLMEIYESAFKQFSAACRFTYNGKAVKKSIGCIKHALKLEGVIDSDAVASGTPALTDDDRREFERRYALFKEAIAEKTDRIWISRSSSE